MKRKKNSKLEQIKIDHHKRKTIIIHNLDTRKKKATGYNLWSDRREDGEKNAAHSSS